MLSGFSFAVLATAAAALPAANAAAVIDRRQQNETFTSSGNDTFWAMAGREPGPLKLPACATADDLLFQPVLDFDTDGCYNVAAIGPNGFLNPGLGLCEGTRTPQDGCRDPWHLTDHQQVYARSRCNSGWCAHMYGYYFERDQASLCGGHRHDWEHVVVWAQDGVPRYVGASQHGEYEIRAWADVRVEGAGTHPKVVYHKDGLSTHCFRFANAADDAVENHLGRWFAGDLLSYNGFPTTALRAAMLNNNWGSGNIDFRDDRFAAALGRSKHSSIVFDLNRDEGSPGQPAGCGASFV